MVSRAQRAWSAAGLEGIGFQECRHTFITTMIAAGLNAKAVSVLAGHALISITFVSTAIRSPGTGRRWSAARKLLFRAGRRCGQPSGSPRCLSGFVSNGVTNDRAT